MSHLVQNILVTARKYAECHCVVFIVDIQLQGQIAYVNMLDIHWWYKVMVMLASTYIAGEKVCTLLLITMKYEKCHFSYPFVSLK